MSRFSEPYFPIIRKYLTTEERTRFAVVAARAPPLVQFLCLGLMWSGCRLSEWPSLTPQNFDYARGVVLIHTLKRRKSGIFREVPLPPFFLHEMNVALHIEERLHTSPHTRIWTCERTTAWRQVKAVMQLAFIHAPQASPKALRHTFAVDALQAGVPITLVQRWLGHASSRTTEIYLHIVGREERGFAEKLWKARRGK